MIKDKKKITFEDQDIYVGIDVHKSSWTVAICTEHRCYRPFTLSPPRVEGLIGYLEKNFPLGFYMCAYEAGFSGFGLCEALFDYGITCLVVNPADIPTSGREAEFKTDSRDAAKIARCLRSGELESIYQPPKQLQGDRALARLQDQFRKDVVRQKSRIKMFLYYFGIKIPAEFDNKGRWSRAFIQWLYQLEMPTPNATAVLQHQMGQLVYCLGMKRNVEQWLRDLSHTDAYCPQADLMETVPGFGRLTAIKFLLQLGPINRFSSMDALHNYAGLVPASRDSGETTRRNRITQRGHTQLRAMLVEAAWTAIGVDPALSHCFAELKKRMPAQKAIIRIAKKLLARIRFVLINETPYEKGILA